MYNPNAFQQSFINRVRGKPIIPGCVYSETCDRHVGFTTGVCFLATIRRDIGFIVPDFNFVVRLIKTFHSIGKIVRVGMEYGSLWIYGDDFKCPLDVGDEMMTTYDGGSYIWCDFSRVETRIEGRTYIKRIDANNEVRFSGPPVNSRRF